VATTASVDRLLAIDNDQVTRASFVNTLLPLVAGMLGVILLVVGILLARRPREDVTAGPSARSPELAAAEPTEDAGGSAATQASLVPGLDEESREAAQPEAAQAEAVQAEEAEEEAPKAEAPAEAAAESNGEAKAEPPAAEARAEAAEDEAPTAEIPAATAEQADAAAPDDAPEAKPRRGGAHRR
jgi:hypothetical protein